MSRLEELQKAVDDAREELQKARDAWAAGKGAYADVDDAGAAFRKARRELIAYKRKVGYEQAGQAAKYRA